MLERVRAELLRALRVPHEPAPPEGSPESIRVFRAGRNYYRWRVVMWALTQVGVLLGFTMALLVFGPVARRLPPWMKVTWQVAEAVTLTGLVASAPVTLYAQRLNYELRWYIVTDRSLRIRCGIWDVEELTMTFANIQDIRLKAGPLQGWLGLADLEVSSAGGGGSIEHSAVAGTRAARFAGIDNAEMVRDLIVERLRQYRDTGLGDTDAETQAPHSAEDAARGVLDEVRALRAAMAKKLNSVSRDPERL
ncbi:MAG: PH domain-containing protein [Acidobacteria bacterium]|nr:PH domain-containing protein [Acidobacteriota bacterium]